MPIETGLVADQPKVYDIDAARKAGVPEDQILGALRGKFGKLYDYDGALKAGIPVSKINDTVAAKVNDPVGNFDILKQGLTDAKDKTIDLVKPIADSAATIGAGAETGPIGGLAAGAATDAFLQRLQSATAQQKNQTTLSKVAGAKSGSVADTALNAIQNEGLNELLGKVFTTVGGKVKSLFTPVDPALGELKPTFSQYGGGKLSSMIENIWGSDAKQKAMQESANAARTKFEDLVVRPQNPNDIFGIGKLNSQFQDSKRILGTLSKINTVQVPGENTLPSGNINPFPQPSTVEGPVYLNNTVKEAQKILDSNANLNGNKGFEVPGDTNQKLVKQAELILQYTDNGKKPIPFQDAMDILHGPDGDGGLRVLATKDHGELGTVKDSQNDIAKNLDYDILQSFKNWHGGPEAKDAYNTARSSAIIKQTLAEGGNVQNLVSNVNGPIPQIDKALQNPVQTQKLLNTSNLSGVKSSNMRQDLAGYRLQQIWNSGDSGTGLVDGKKLLAEWNDPAYQATKDQLYSKQTQDQLTQFFQNVNKVSQNGMGGQYGLTRLGYHGISLAASLLTGGLTGHAIESFAAMEIPPYAIAKIMTNPVKAQVLQRLIANEPLEMSTQQAGRLIMSGLNGMTVSLVDGNGKRRDAKIVNGQVQ